MSRKNPAAHLLYKKNIKRYTTSLGLLSKAYSKQMNFSCESGEDTKQRHVSEDSPSNNLITPY